MFIKYNFRYSENIQAEIKLISYLNNEFLSDYKQNKTTFELNLCFPRFN